MFTEELYIFCSPGVSVCGSSSTEYCSRYIRRVNTCYFTTTWQHYHHHCPWPLLEHRQPVRALQASQSWASLSSCPQLQPILYVQQHTLKGIKSLALPASTVLTSPEQRVEIELFAHRSDANMLYTEMNHFTETHSVCSCHIDYSNTNFTRASVHILCMHPHTSWNDKTYRQNVFLRKLQLDHGVSRS